MHAYTLPVSQQPAAVAQGWPVLLQPLRYWSVRPFGCAVLLGCVDEELCAACKDFASLA